MQCSPCVIRRDYLLEVTEPVSGCWPLKDEITPPLSASPEKLVLGRKIYSVDSKCARTFLFVGDVVAWSHLPHLCIINGLRKMADANDLKTAKAYSTRFYGKLDP